MKRISRRHITLLGVLGVAALIWAVDSYRGGPRAAGAKQSGQPSAKDKPIAWHDLSDLVGQRTATRYVPLAGEIGESERDLFAPPAAMEAALAAVSQEQAAVAVPPSETDDQPSDFAARHTLAGVVLGLKPRAVVDGRLLSLGDELGGYRLVVIERDMVVFERVGGVERVTLALSPRPKSR